ncbi:MAG: hypothetical protein KGZ56_10435 [Dethiobacter sp.]|jgi:hypothetical protein|nr:hypothetical protein [Dethiobacter sp.]MBS3897251.1 hypothetical protein [Dethiobacter sp.]
MAKKKKNEITIRSSSALYLTFVSSSGGSGDSVEIRHEDENISIPSYNAITSFDEHYIFINDDGELEYRTKGVSRPLLQGIAEKIDFEISFSAADANPNLLAFNISGIRETGHTYALSSKVYLENLTLNNRIITGSLSGRLRFIKTPSATPAIISVKPTSVFTAQHFNGTFELTLHNDRFLVTDKSNILLGNDFKGLAVTSYSVDVNDDIKARIALS